MTRETRDERKRLLNELHETDAWELLVLPTLAAKIEAIKLAAIGAAGPEAAAQIAELRGQYRVLIELMTNDTRFFGAD